MNTSARSVLAGILASALFLAPVSAFADEAVLPEAPPAEALPGEASSTPELATSTPDIASTTPEAVATEALAAEGAPTTELIVKYADEEGIQVVETTDPVHEAIREIEADPNVEYAEPNYARSLDSIPTDDALRASLWALENTGQSVNGTAGAVDADADGLEAWDRSTGTSTLIAIIDTGVDYTHPDLDANLWDGSACVDEEGAALGGCLHGYDFENDDLDPLQTGSSTQAAHGTHVAGILAAEKGNGIGVIGMAPDATLMVLRFGLDTASEVRAIDFARENGARIINASFGGTGFSEAEYEAIERFTDAGGIFIASAGNDDASLEDAPAYPASYDLDGIVSVAATDQEDALASFSNYGELSVDLAAPGVNIRSTLPTTTTSIYGYKNGTSMAAPYVAGALALGMSLRSDLSIAALKALLLASGDPLAGLADTTVSGRRLNAASFLAAVATAGDDTTPPVIALIGDSSMTVAYGASFTDPGATVTDDTDGTRTILGTGSVDTSDDGTYQLAYNATDEAGNAAAEVIRTVTVSAAPSAPSRRHGGGGGGGGGGGSRTSEPSLPRTLYESPAALTPETRAALIQALMAQVQALLKLLAELRAAGG